MQSMRVVALLLIGCALLACARPRAGDVADDGIEAAPATGLRPPDCRTCAEAPTTLPGRATTSWVDPPLGPPDRWATRRIGASSDRQSSAARPRRVKSVDIDLVAAPFDEVARLLADAGHFNVVVEAPGASAVTVKLRDVEPYDALVAIAQVRGIDVHYRAGVVIVGKDAPRIGGTSPD